MEYAPASPSNIPCCASQLRLERADCTSMKSYQWVWPAERKMKWTIDNCHYTFYYRISNIRYLSPPTTHCAFHRSWSSSHPAAFYQSDLRWGHQRKRQSAESRVQQDEADNQQIDVLRTPEPVCFTLQPWNAHQANDHEHENELN